MNITVLKTLPHLHAWHLQQDNYIAYAQSYSPDIEKYLSSCETFSMGDKTLKFKSILSKLKNFTRVTKVSQLEEYSITGDILSIWPIGYDLPVKLDFFGEDLHSIYSYNLVSGSRVMVLNNLVLGNYFIETNFDKQQISINPSSKSNLSVIFTNHNIAPLQASFSQSQITYPSLYWSNSHLITSGIQTYLNQGFKVYVLTKHPQNLPSEVASLVSEVPSSWLDLNLLAGFINGESKQVLLTDRELFGSIFLSQRTSTYSTNAQKLLAHIEGEIQVGDYLVHTDYGIGIYNGLTQEVVNESLQEYLEIKYAGEDTLLVPINQLSKLTKFIGDGNKVNVSTLKGSAWATLTSRVKKLAQIKAAELVEHYARASLGQAKSILPQDSNEYLEFLKSFPYSDTQDQQQSTQEVIADLQQNKPMNRLLVGDVGFGKTEVAMRAAFKVLESGNQVAVLCPTTVLAAQHWKNFSARFVGFKFPIYYLSRSVSTSKVKEQIEQINQGAPGIIIGTHKLLSSGIKFSSTGLLIIDEEQRFGVKQKEQVRKLNYSTHYLSISATPIPRTLSIALSGMQSISVIATPPKGRKPIITKVIEYDWEQIKVAINTELENGGQVYFVHNQVASINSLAAQLKLVMPNINICIAHGQMPIKQVEQAMEQFYSGQAQVLIASAIIENGLDVKGVNTIIINQAHKFGLSSLYQLRGRVGRSNLQAYCYLIYGSKAQTLAQERLDSLVASSTLGSGFTVASKDLELRGAGELLGAKQSGHISKVGYALYMQLLAQEIDKLKAGEKFNLPEFVSL